MRVVFLGTAPFAVPSLQALLQHHDVAAVVTQPDRPGDRGRPAPRPVADVARAHGVEVRAPQRVRDAEAVAEIGALSPDAIVVAAYGQILPQALLDVPRLGAVNVHASLLPRWRGASPVAHAILAGDAETGVTIMRMDAGLDTGAIYAQRRIEIAPDATTPALSAALAELGAPLLLDVLLDVAGGRAHATPQPAEGVTLAPRLRREDGVVRWTDMSASDVDRRVRALQPWPGVTAPLAGAPVRIVAGAAEPGPADVPPGEVARTDRESVTVAARSGAYRIDSVLPAGSRQMPAAAFLRGRRMRK